MAPVGYGKGTFSLDLMAHLQWKDARANTRILIDPAKCSDWRMYAPCELMQLVAPRRLGHRNSHRHGAGPSDLDPPAAFPRVSCAGEPVTGAQSKTLATGPRLVNGVMKRKATSYALFP
ncbi:MAG: hypothetical protein FJ276_07955 [Planctomycetes bacterium]|nr:hypothetical protein [Planctomycetota bacterium]